MKNGRRIVAYIVYMVLGLALVVLGILEIVDPFWSGMGGALIAVGVIRMIHILRYRYDEAYRENMEIETKDERNRFIRNKAWAWAGYLFVMIMAVASIILKIAGQDLLSIFASGMVCLVIVLFWGSYLILKRKY